MSNHKEIAKHKQWTRVEVYKTATSQKNTVRDIKSIKSGFWGGGGYRDCLKRSSRAYITSMRFEN